MKGIFSVLVENKDGVLSQISGLFARRGFNIDSLAVGETERHDISSMTIVSTGDQRTVDQIEKHLNKKLDVIKVRRLEENRSVLLEMMLKIGRAPQRTLGDDAHQGLLLCDKPQLFDRALQCHGRKDRPRLSKEHGHRVPCCTGCDHRFY